MRRLCHPCRLFYKSNMSPKISKEILRVVVVGIVLYVLLWAKLNCDSSKEAPQCTNSPVLDATIYDKVKVFLLFIGYNRSRHTLMASLLDAHPNVIIANDFNILGQWINNYVLSERNKYYMYEMLYAKSRYDVMYGVRSRMVDGQPVQYHYNIKGQWQGKYNNNIQVIGDKKAAKASAILLQREGRDSLRKLEENLGVQIKFIHVIRNPFDNIATMALRLAGCKKNQRQDDLKCNCTEELDMAIDEYRTQVRGSAAVKKYFPGRVLDVESMHLTTNTKEALMKVCEFLEITCSQKYLDDCTSIVDPVPSKTRHLVQWTNDQLSGVYNLTKIYKFLERFELE